MTGIFKLSSGGLLINYRCEAACAHCMYMCSPNRDAGSISLCMAEQVFEKAQELNCPSMHISGGEPFLDLEKLFDVLKLAKKKKMPISYIETSVSWCKDEKEAMEILAQVKALGVDCLSISVSPYHNEFIPADNIFRCLSVCRELDITTYVWQDEFLPDLIGLSTDQTHSLADLQAHNGPRYLAQIPARFGLSMIGRALITHKKTMPVVPVSRIAHMSRSCAEIGNRSHFHIDMYGRYIPPGCVGISLPLEALGVSLDPEEYPVITRLMQSPKHLLDYCKGLGFSPENNYYNRCHLCQCMRSFLWQNFPGRFQELQPDAFYRLYESEQSANT